MGNTININDFTRLSGNMPGSGTIQRTASQGGDFLSMAARRRMLMKLRLNGGSVSAAELLMGLL